MRRVTIVVLAAAIPAFAGTFLFKTDQILLHQERDQIILLLANPLEGIVEEIVLTFPGLIRVDDVYVHAGIMDWRQAKRELVFSGALWRQGFVRLSWRPALLPLTITARSATEEWTLEVSSGFVYGEPEVFLFPQGILVGRSESVGQTLQIRFDQQVTITSVMGIGCSPAWEASDRELTVHGPFFPGSMVLISWNHPDAQVMEVVWNDRPASLSPSGPWEIVNLGGGRFRFSAKASSDVQVFWDLGDGTITWQRDFEHVYSHADKYLVTLILSDARGQKRVQQTWLSVEPPSVPAPVFAGLDLPPRANPGGPYGPYDPVIEQREGEWVRWFTVQFDASASFAYEGKIVKYVWDLGNGQVIVTESPYLTYTYVFPNVDHHDPPLIELYGFIYSVPVTLTVEDDKGRTGTATTHVLVIWYPIW